MTRVVISPSHVAAYPEGGGHFWVYMQYALGLRSLGCDTYWVEEVPWSPGVGLADYEVFLRRMSTYGLRDRVLLYDRDPDDQTTVRYLTQAAEASQEVIRTADLFLNFHYAIPEAVLALARRSALVDIDPGLLQFWMSTGQLTVLPHDVYFTIGETVGQAGSPIPDVGISWNHIHPPIYLPEWPYVFDQASESFTTVSGWWGGGGKGEWITDGKSVFFENNKRVTFLEFVDVPRLSRHSLELALAMGEGDDPAASDERDERWIPFGSDEGSATDYVSDALDRRMLERHGWRVRSAQEVASTPDDYRSYLQRSRGEFSCAKPSCMFFENAWVSDRTICYLASGKPVVVQDTGRSAILPNGEGMFRFGTVEEAVASLDEVDSDYRRHSQAARAIAETLFDSRPVLDALLRHALVS